MTPATPARSPAAGDPGADTGVVVVYVTVPDARVAETIAQAVVGEHLAACVNVVPGLRSFYWWQGAVHDDPELLLVIKTPRARLADLEARVLALHPYDLPELVALPVVAGSAAYLDWVHASARP